MTTPEDLYDVAFSLTSPDGDFVNALVKALPDKRCFFYVEQDRSLIGASAALGPMRRAFRKNSRLNVIVHRPPWGEIGYTKFEQDAIIDAYFNTKDSLLPFLIRMDLNYAPPVWYPEHATWCDPTLYEIEQIAAQITDKLEARPRVFNRTTPSSDGLAHMIDVRTMLGETMLKRMEIGKRKHERDRLLKTSDGYDLALAYMNSLIEEFDAEIPFLMGFDSTMDVKWTKTGPPPTWFVMSSPTLGVAIKWDRDGGPSVRDDRLVVEFYKDPITVPGQMEIPFYWHKEGHRGPRIARKLIYKADFNLAGSFVWKSGEDVLDFDALGGFIMEEFEKIRFAEK